MNELSNDASQQVKGFIYQFLIALEKCFEMREGQSVYIECHGDVSIEGADEAVQTEVKYYKKQLTDLDPNVWKTIANWSNPEFEIDKYDSLVLLTTQKIGLTSKWDNWNNKSFVERKSIVQALRTEFGAKLKKGKDLKKAMDVIFAEGNESRLDTILTKMSLDTQNMDSEGYYSKLCERYAKHLPNMRKREYIQDLYAYIINPHLVEGKWVISYEDFSLECRRISQKLIDNTVVFPEKRNLREIPVNQYQASNFVTKIHDIQYDDVIPEAVEDYVNAGMIILDEFKESPAIMPSYKRFEEELERTYKGQYRIACRNSNPENIINESQNLYDKITTTKINGRIHAYSDVPLDFQNGVMQILAEEKDDVVWLLKSKNDE